MHWLRSTVTYYYLFYILLYLKFFFWLYFITVYSFTLYSTWHLLFWNGLINKVYLIALNLVYTKISSAFDDIFRHQQNCLYWQLSVLIIIKNIMWHSKVLMKQFLIYKLYKIFLKSLYISYTTKLVKKMTPVSEKVWELWTLTHWQASVLNTQRQLGSLPLNEERWWVGFQRV